MTARLTTPLVISIGIAALAAGCGGGGSGSSSVTVSTSSLSKAQFREKAHVACVLGRLKATGFEAGGSKASESEVLPKAVKVVVVPAFQEVIDKIRDLGAPKGEQSQIEAFLSSMQEGVDTLEERSASISSIEEIEKPLRAAGKLALAVGLNQCVYGE